MERLSFGNKMRLIIGGKAQGKLEYAKKTYNISDVTDGAHCNSEALADAICIDNLHEYIRKNHIGTKCKLPKLRDNVIIICDDVGCGIVPVDREERAFREAVGRVCTELAVYAESVERIFCGISIRIK